MATSPGEKSFNIDIPEDLYNQVEDFIESHNRPKKKQVGTAMVRLFLRLPADVQVRLVNNIDQDEDLVSIVNLIVDRRMKENSVADDALAVETLIGDARGREIMHLATAHVAEQKRSRGDTSEGSA